MPVHVSSYEGGIDRDSSKNKYPKGSYYKMKNFRLISFDELSNGSVTSIKGNKPITILDTHSILYSDDIVIGWLVIRNYLIVWSTNCHDAIGGRGSILRTDLSVVAPHWDRVYSSDDMMLSTLYPIAEETVGYYESDKIIKSYWTDKFNMFRYINVAPGATIPTSTDLINILSNVVFTIPIVTNIGGGNIPVGKIQYAYQYYNVGGNETIYSPTTPLIHLTKSSEGLTYSNIRTYEGSGALDDSGNPNISGKSVTLNLGVLDSNYQKVRVVAILYSNLNQVPEIHIVGEYDVVTNLIIVDYGVYSKGTITLNEFRTLGSGEIYPKTISQKGNKLLMANITEKFFDIDFDTRAYRWKRVGASTPYAYQCTLWNSKTQVYDHVVKTGIWPNATYTLLNTGLNIPETHDCICSYNYDFVNNRIPEEATYDYTNANAFKWQGLGINDAPVMGGDGPNVKYTFIYQEMTHEESNNTRYNQPDIVTIQNLSSFDSYKNPMRTISFMSNKRDEVYRYAMVLVNNKGQESFAKWIADIKIPIDKDRSAYSLALHTTVNKIYALGVQFTVNTANLLTNDVVAIKIVRVERKKEDRSILTQGIASKMFLISGGVDGFTNRIGGYPRAVIKRPTEGLNSSFTTQDKVVQFISPDVNFFKDISPQTTDYLKIQGCLRDRKSYLSIFPAISADTIETIGDDERTDAIHSSTFPSLYATHHWINYSKYFTTDTSMLTTLPLHNILSGVLAGEVEALAEDENVITLANTPGGYGIVNRSVDALHRGISGTCLILVLDSSISSTPLNVIQDELAQYLIDYKRPGIAASQYGGLTYEARQSNEYIDCGPYTPIISLIQNMNVYGGDIFINFFEHLRTMWECDDNDGDTIPDVLAINRFCSVVSFPCESHINLGLDNGYSFSKNYTNPFIHAIREKIGNWNADLYDTPLPNTDYDLIQDKNMYEYNPVFSQQNTSKVTFSKPNNWLATVNDDTLVKISLEKSAREEVDSYIKFLPDNEKTLPTQFGPINDLFLFKNYMMVFMDHAFGSLSIDERAVLPIQNNSILELGAANNLQFFDFISDSSGSIHPSSINKIGNGFGWYDAYLNSFGYYNGETQDIGLTKGLSSEIKKFSDLIKKPGGGYYNNQLHGGNFLMFENKKYKESICAMIVSELVSYSTKDATSVTFILSHSPGNYNGLDIVINGIEYTTDITGTNGVGILVINNIDNPGLDINAFSVGWYFVYYKDLSKVFTFNSVLNSFQLEIDMFPQHLIEYNDDLYEIFNRLVVYQENEGNYGEFYGIYRNGEIEYLVNPQRSLVCVFNNYTYAMEAIDDNEINQIDETWNSLRTYNDYQDSTETVLVVGDNVKRRMRTWRIKDLRDNRVDDPRMRDSYLRLIFKYMHGDNKRIVMHDLYTYYTMTRESLAQNM